MNCPSRTDEVEAHPTWNQNPDALSNDLTTRQDFNGIANLRISRDHLPPEDAAQIKKETRRNENEARFSETSGSGNALSASRSVKAKSTAPCSRDWRDRRHKHSVSLSHWPLEILGMPVKRLARSMVHLAAFVGPGFLVAVAYIDPGNYATDVSAGAETRYKLLFVVLISNVFAVILQSLSIRLGTVTGRNLSEHCRVHLPKWLNLSIYALAEVAIIATDIAEACTLRKFQAWGCHITNKTPGDRICDSTELTIQDPIGWGMCYYSGRCASNPLVLYPGWLIIALTDLRVLRCIIGSRSGYMFLRPAISSEKHLCRRGFLWVPPFVCRGRRTRHLSKLWNPWSNCHATFDIPWEWSSATPSVAF